MTVYVNREPLEFTEAVSVSTVLLHAQINAERGIAIAVNNAVVSKTTWDTFMLEDMDKLTIIKATQGG